MNKQSASEESIFLEAVSIRSEQERQAFLDQACGGDPNLREGVEALLAASAQSGDILDVTQASSPKVDRAGTVDRPGSMIGPYKVLQEIGEGGMGVVYMAEQSQPVKRRVALKIVKPGMDSRQIVARFEAERQTLAMMDHPNVARVLDAGATDAGRPYFVMELVKGTPITKYCDDKQLTTRERLELFAAVCHAVQHAHHKGIIHRDLKPSNILVAEYDDRAVPKVIDFGVAKALNQTLTEKTMFTQFGQIVGTFEYMSPEQAKLNQLDVDTRSDVYSLGVVLYELLTGTTPFEKQRLRSSSFDELLRIIGEEEPPRPSTRLGSSETLPALAASRSTDARRLAGIVRGELDWIVMRALEKDRTRRYETASALAADVERYLNDEPVQACPPSAGYRLRKFARRHRTGLSRSAIAAAFVGLAVVAAMLGWQYHLGLQALASQQDESQMKQQELEKQQQKQREARDRDIPKLEELVDEKEFVSAFLLAADLEEVLGPGEPMIAQLRKEFAHDWSLQSYPEGADVYWCDYGDPKQEWKLAGRTPIEAVSLPNEMLLWKVGREGFGDVIGCRRPEEERVAFTLDRTGELPEGMVRVSGNAYRGAKRQYAELEIDDFFIDRCEVTNRQFKEFVDAGGYENPRCWDAEFESERGKLDWEQVKKEFIDTTGRPGPAVWRDGTYPEGEADLPVRGVSWYEAAAYARFADKQLPSVVHWYRASGCGWNRDMQIAGQSHINSDRDKPVAVGSMPGIGPFGTFDMAGNVAEWCDVTRDSSEFAGDGEPVYSILGAAWDDVAYKFSQSDSLPPLTRSEKVGFRCAKPLTPDSPIGPVAMGEDFKPRRDYFSETPVGDEMFELFRSIHAYSKSKLNAEITATLESEKYVHEVVEIDAAYGPQRVALHILRPKEGSTRYQPVLFFPGVGHFKLDFPFPVQPIRDAQGGHNFQRLDEQSGLARVWSDTLFLAQSGRAVVFPVYEGSFDRRWSNDYHVHHFLDLARAIDYLETRPDMDLQHIAYLGTSMGAVFASRILALEPRIQAAIMYHGGLRARQGMKRQFDPFHYLPRVKAATLVVNNRDDPVFPYEASQIPAYHFLGTAPENKAWIVSPGRHMGGYTTGNTSWRADALAWLDLHLGPVGPQNDFDRLNAQANFAVARGDWETAARLFVEATAFESAKLEPLKGLQRAGLEGQVWMRAAAALLMAGDEEGYRELCRKMVETFAGRKQPWVQERVLKTCCMRPDAVDLSALPVDELAAGLEQGSVNNSNFLRWLYIACAMASLRRGDGDQAIDWTDRAREVEQPSNSQQALCLAIGALVKQQLGRSDEAGSSLEAAAWLIDEHLPHRNGEVDPHFAMRGQSLRVDWLIAEFLRREAEERLATPAGA